MLFKPNIYKVFEETEQFLPLPHLISVKIKLIILRNNFRRK